MAVQSVPGDVVARSLDLGVGHAEHLAPLVKQVLAEASLQPVDIKHIICTVGPGSFMGVRVGISFAKGFAFAHGAKTHPLTTLEALWLATPNAENGFTLIDARRGQVYGQGFGTHATDSFLLDYDVAIEKVGDAETLTGSGVPILFQGRESSGPDVPDMAIAIANLTHLTEGPLTSLYLRPPDAKPSAKSAP